jgi:hypothetical protein
VRLEHLLSREDLLPISFEIVCALLLAFPLLYNIDYQKLNLVMVLTIRVLDICLLIKSRSSVWLEHYTDNVGVSSSNLLGTTRSFWGISSAG